MLSKLNAWIVERLTKAKGGDSTRVIVESSGLKVQSEREEYVVLWSAVKRIAAYTRPQVIGETLCIALELEDGGVLEVSERTTGWEQMVTELGAHIPLTVSGDEWRTRLLADPSQAIVLFGGPPGNSSREQT